MAFNVDQRLAGIEPPSFTYRGRTYTGRILSAEEWQPFQDRVRTFQANPDDTGSLLEVFRDYAIAAFGVPGWRFWRPHIPRILMKLPPAIMLETFMDFFGCQRRATTKEKKNPTSTKE